MLAEQWYDDGDDETTPITAQHRRRRRMADVTWDYFRSSVTTLGPAFVKLFQWVATRRDIFPPNVCDRLAVLHDRGIAHDWKHTDQALRDAFGDYRAKGLHVEEDVIIGTGSAAQVYRGTLDVPDPVTGDIISKPVAIKVLHPRLDYLVARDLWLVQTIANIMHALPVERIRMLNLPRATDNFGSILQRQADLRVEASNLVRFRSNFFGNSTNDEQEGSLIFFPQPMNGWISSTVLVEDLVHDAKPISEYLKDSSEEGQVIRKELAGPMLRAFLKMIFLDNFVHCDLHAGNVLVQTRTIQRKSMKPWDFLFKTSNDGEQTFRQIVFLDAGIATSLSPSDQRNLIDLFRAVILNEGNQAGRLMVERARHERCSQVPGGVDAFANGIEQLVAEFHDRRNQGLNLGAVRIGSLLSRVLDLCRIHGVEIDPAMASIVISTLVLEGLGRSLAPSLNLIDFALPFVLGRGRV
jgi:aarF domain-containing kinase